MSSGGSGSSAPPPPSSIDSWRHLGDGRPMRRWIMLPLGSLLAVTGCTSVGSSTPSESQGDLSTGAAVDSMTAAGDLGSVGDAAAPVDAAVDLATPDLPMPLDLVAIADLSSTHDFSI